LAILQSNFVAIKSCQPIVGVPRLLSFKNRRLKPKGKLFFLFLFGLYGHSKTGSFSESTIDYNLVPSSFPKALEWVMGSRDPPPPPVNLGKLEGRGDAFMIMRCS
jgi:hypothetical protein